MAFSSSSSSARVDTILLTIVGITPLIWMAVYVKDVLLAFHAVGILLECYCWQTAAVNRRTVLLLQVPLLALCIISVTTPPYLMDNYEYSIVEVLNTWRDVPETVFVFLFGGTGGWLLAQMGDPSWTRSNQDDSSRRYPCPKYWRRTTSIILGLCCAFGAYRELQKSTAAMAAANQVCPIRDRKCSSSLHAAVQDVGITGIKEDLSKNYCTAKGPATMSIDIDVVFEYGSCKTRTSYRINCGWADYLRRTELHPDPRLDAALPFIDTASGFASWKMLHNFQEKYGDNVTFADFDPSEVPFKGPNERAWTSDSTCKAIAMTQLAFDYERGRVSRQVGFLLVGAALILCLRPILMILLLPSKSSTSSPHEPMLLVGGDLELQESSYESMHTSCLD